LEYGAVRRFSFIRPGRSLVEGDVQPGWRVFWEYRQATGLRYGRCAASWDKFENLSGPWVRAPLALVSCPFDEWISVESPAEGQTR
jgi:hypothetical protein